MFMLLMDQLPLLRRRPGFLLFQHPHSPLRPYCTSLTSPKRYMSGSDGKSSPAPLLFGLASYYSLTSQLGGPAGLPSCANRHGILSKDHLSTLPSISTQLFNQYSTLRPGAVNHMPLLSDPLKLCTNHDSVHEKPGFQQ